MSRGYDYLHTTDRLMTVADALARFLYQNKRAKELESRERCVYCSSYICSYVDLSPVVNTVFATVPIG